MLLGENHAGDKEGPILPEHKHIRSICEPPFTAAAVAVIVAAAVHPVAAVLLLLQLPLGVLCIFPKILVKEKSVRAYGIKRRA